MWREDEESLFEAETGRAAHALAGAGLLAMKLVFAIPETILCASFAIIGAYMLEEGVADRSAMASVLVLAGAAFLAIGMVTLEGVVRSILWHRAMLRHATGQQPDQTREIAPNQE